LYVAANHLFATEDEGKTWQMISHDLTTNDKKKQASSGGPITQDNTSVEYYCTIFYATESWVEKDLLWTGSDDGLVHVSRDGGKSWENVTPKNIPPWIMWNCIEVDPFKKGAAYIVGTRYKLDDFKSYIYKTEDYGKTWKPITNGIDPMHFSRCLRADRKRPGLLYAGTEYGMYISYDDGANWRSFQLNLPEVPITDLAIKNNDLIVGTQGRSIYILDDLTLVQERDPAVLNKSLHVFSVNPAFRMPGGRGRRGRGTATATVLRNEGANPPNGVVLNYFVKAADDSTRISIHILDKNKKLVKSFSNAAKDNKIEMDKGMNQFEWDMNYPDAERLDGLILWNGQVGGPKAAPGSYFARFKMANDSLDVPFTILADPNYKASQAELEEQFNHLVTIRDKFSAIIKAIKNIRDIRQQMADLAARSGKELPKEIKQQMDTVGKQITAVEEALHQTKAKSSQDVLNYPIRLDDKLASIYNASAAGQSGLSKQSKDAYAELVVLIDQQLNKLRSIMNEDVARLNQLIHEKSLPVIGAKME
jgi:hypothetical protein